MQSLRTSSINTVLASTRTPSRLSATFTSQSRNLTCLAYRLLQPTTSTSTISKTQTRSTLTSRPTTTLYTARFASTSTATTTTTTTSPSVSSSTTAPDPSAPILTWNEFLRLRKLRRFFNLGASALTSISSLAIGSVLLQGQNIEYLSSVLMGLDPLFVVGLWGVSFFGLGWLAGPLLGGLGFRVLYGKYAKGMAAKHADFYARIRKHRVDPSTSSMQNPLPDYYGEKITSVQGYRMWLKDQRAFNRKRQGFA